MGEEIIVLQLQAGFLMVFPTLELEGCLIVVLLD
jgi:hypothetical protein